MLMVVYEGTIVVKAIRENTLNRKYEHFLAQLNESINQTFNRFNCLINDMRIFDIFKHASILVLKFLDYLDEKWEHHVEMLKNSETIHSMDLSACIEI